MSDLEFDLAEKFAALTGEDARIHELNRRIAENYDSLAEDEIVCLESQCENSFTEMIWVIEVNNKSVLVWDYHHDIDYPRVNFPDEIRELLKPRDVFLATIGMKSGRWQVLFLSPRYEIPEGDSVDDECELCRAEGLATH